MMSADAVIYWAPYTHGDWHLILAASAQGLCYVGLPHAELQDLEQFVERHCAGSTLQQDVDRLKAARQQLDEYFAQSRRRFDLALDFRGTPFQMAVWQALSGIPYGETRSYGEIAREIGRPAAVRAVGAANGHNPIPIVVPCHRVIGSNGTLTGYRGGLEVKRLLLQLEGLVLSSGDGQARFAF